MSDRFMAQDNPPIPVSGRFEALVALIRALRTPGSGCPWDLEQTFQTIAPYTIEEAYEVADAIARGDMADLRDELGDLLFQVVFHARMAEEAGHFAIGDVCDAIVSKMQRRHPHVFADAPNRSAEEQTHAWETLKAGERQARAGKAASALDGVAAALPAAKRAQKLQQRAARVGFDWPSPAGARDKIVEELGEIDRARDSAGLAEEAGDLLFSAVNYVRLLGLDAETVLNDASRKFESRFKAMEALAATRRQRFETLAPTDQEALWSQVKKDL